MSTPLVIWLVGDGKPGHENQSLGLIEALGRRVETTLHRISLTPKARLIPRLRETFRQSRTLPRPDLIIGAGHATHVPLIGLARRTGTPCVVLMKPSLPCGLFDLCLVPAHDLRGAALADNVIPTTGALNRVSPVGGESKDGHLFLIGGPSSTHGWNHRAILDAIGGLLAADPGVEWELTDSRRTPVGMRAAIVEKYPHLAVFPHEDTGPGWLPARLAGAKEVWVSEDSVSMVYEALSSGAAVGLLPVPREKAKAKGRVARGIDRLIEEHWVTPHAAWEKTRHLPPPEQVLREADRCADLILGRWFQRPTK